METRLSDDQMSFDTYRTSTLVGSGGIEISPLAVEYYDQNTGSYEGKAADKWVTGFDTYRQGISLDGRYIEDHSIYEFEFTAPSSVLSQTTLMESEGFVAFETSGNSFEAYSFGSGTTTAFETNSVTFDANTTYKARYIVEGSKRSFYIMKKDGTDDPSWFHLGDITDTASISSAKTRGILFGRHQLNTGRNLRDGKINVGSLKIWIKNELVFDGSTAIDGENGFYLNGLPTAWGSLIGPTYKVTAPGLAKKDLSNLDDDGEAKFAAKQDKLIAGDGITLANQTIDHLNVSGFSGSNYITVPASTFFGSRTSASKWEMVLKIKTPTISSTVNFLLGPTVGFYSLGIATEMNANGTNWRIRFGLSSNGYSWDIGFFGPNTYTVLPETWYWVKYSYAATGTISGSSASNVYKIELSTDGTNWEEYYATTQSTAPYLSSSATVQMGNTNSSAYQAYAGTIDLKSCYTSVDGVIVWDGSTAVADTDYTVVGSPAMVASTEGVTEIGTAAQYIPLTQKAEADGVATLDSNALIPTTQLPIIDGGNANA